MFHILKQIVEMNDFDQQFHHQDENDINILHYDLIKILILDIQIHLDHKLQEEKNKIVVIH